MPPFSWEPRDLFIHLPHISQDSAHARHELDTQMRTLSLFDFFVWPIIYTKRRIYHTASTTVAACFRAAHPDRGPAPVFEYRANNTAVDDIELGDLSAAMEAVRLLQVVQGVDTSQEQGTQCRVSNGASESQQEEISAQVQRPLQRSQESPQSPQELYEKSHERPPPLIAILNSRKKNQLAASFKHSPSKRNGTPPKPIDLNQGDLRLPPPCTLNGCLIHERGMEPIKSLLYSMRLSIQANVHFIREERRQLNSYIVHGGPQNEEHLRACTQYAQRLRESICLRLQWQMRFENVLKEKHRKLMLMNGGSYLPFMDRP